MNFLPFLARKAVPPILAGYGGGYGYGGGALDIYGRKRGPSAHELAHNFRGLVYACANLNAEAVASAHLRLYVRTTGRRRKSYLIDSGKTQPVSRKGIRWLEKASSTAHLMGGATNVREVTSHPVLALLNRPVGIDGSSGGMSRFSLFQTLQLYQEVVGRAYLLIQRGLAGLPREAWILPAHRVIELPDLTGNGVISRYVFESGMNGSDDGYDPADIVPFRMPDLRTASYAGGWGPAAAAFESVRILRQHDAHISAVLDDGGMPGAIFTPKGGSEGETIGQAEARRLAAAFRQQYAASGRGKVMVAEVPGTLEQMAWSPAEVLTPEQYAMARAMVAHCFGVPMTKLDRAVANRASAESGDYAHAVDAILPRLRRNEGALNAGLLPSYEPDVDADDRQLFFAYDEPDAMHNDEAATDRMKTLSSAMTTNEQRDELAKDPIPGGDIRYVSNTMVAISPDTGLPIPGAMPTPPPKPSSFGGGSQPEQPGQPGQPPPDANPAHTPQGAADRAAAAKDLAAVRALLGDMKPDGSE